MAEAGPAATLSAAEVGSWIGYGVDDLDGSAVGQVHGLFVDAGSSEPSWLIVRQGRVRGCAIHRRSSRPVRSYASCDSRPRFPPTT